MCVDGGVRDSAKLLATAAPCGPSRVSWHHPARLWAQEWLPLLKMTKKTKLFFIKELFPLICTGVFIN